MDRLERGQLERQRDVVTDKFMEMNMPGAAVDAATITQTGALMDEISRRLKLLPEIKPNVETTVVTQTHQPYATDCAQFRALIDKVEKFESGREVAEFVSDIDNIYARIRPEIRDEKVVQHNFVSYVMGTMSTSYQQDLRGYEAKNPNKVWTWSNFKDYLTETYETSKTHFQIIQALLKMEKKPSETNIDYSGRIEHYLTRIKTILRARYQTKYGADHAMTTDQVFDIIGAIAHLMKLEKDDNLMNFLSRDLDDCFSSRDIAKHADRYLERRQMADTVLSNPTVNYARNHSDKKRGICHEFRAKGQCDRQNCVYRHSRSQPNQNYSNRGRGGRGASSGSRGSGSWRGKSGGHRGSSGASRGGHRQANFANQGNPAEDDAENDPFEAVVESENHADFQGGSL